LNVYRAVTGINVPVGYRRLGGDEVAGQMAKDDWDDDEN